MSNISTGSLGSGNGTVSLGGIESGLPTSSIIQAYLALDEAPVTTLQNQQTTINTQVTYYQTIQGELTSLQTAGDALAQPDAFANDVSANSTNTAVATATTSTGASPGSVTFSVNQLATADTLVSAGTVASANDVVTTNSDLLVAAGASGLGISSLSGSGLALGAHTIAVTQASAGASVTGSAVIGTSTTIGSSNNVLSVTLDNGTQQNFTIASGTYTQSQLAAAITSASGGTLNASVDSAGNLVLTTTEQGSGASLAIGSGSANGTLGLSSTQASSGTDGIVEVDGQKTTVTDLSGTSPTTLTLSSGTGGTVTATVGAGSGLSIGSLTAQNVSVGNGSLSSVVSAINGANAGVSAQALQVGPNSYALEVSSNETGAGNDVAVDPNAFSGSSLGTLNTSVAGQDAIISLGGSGGYQISSQSNTVTGVLPGVSIALQSTSSAPVTISVTADGTLAATAVGNLVDAANALLETINTDTSYNSQTNVAGPLNGDVELQQLAQSVLGAVGQAIGTSSLVGGSSAGSAAGISLNSDGTINFNQSAFISAFNANPNAVAALFTQGGSFSPEGSTSPEAVQLSFASDNTVPGSYAVSVSQSAQQALDTGSAVFSSPSATLTGGETYSIVNGGSTVTYAVGAGETLANVAAGLDSAFAAAGVNLSAQVVSNGSGSSLQLSSAEYGSGQSFTVSTTGSDELGVASPTAFTGVDVAGTINGVAASGVGQFLTAPSSDSKLAGLSLQVNTTGISSPTTIGTYNYSPGFAQTLASLAVQANATPSGLLPSKIAQLQATSTELGGAIAIEQQVVQQQQTALQDEFNNLETTLVNLKSESSYLTSAFGGTTSGLAASLLGGAGSTSGSNTSSSSSSGTSGG